MWDPFTPTDRSGRKYVFTKRKLNQGTDKAIRLDKKEREKKGFQQEGEKENLIFSHAVRAA